MSESVDTRGVPDCLEYQPGAGSYDVNVYDCRVCGDRLHGTERAVEHTACELDPDCPGCGSADVTPTRGIRADRVDVCQQCGLAFLPGGER